MKDTGYLRSINNDLLRVLNRTSDDAYLTWELANHVYDYFAKTSDLRDNFLSEEFPEDVKETRFSVACILTAVILYTGLPFNSFDEVSKEDKYLAETVETMCEQLKPMVDDVVEECAIAI